jgi:hypothetical protein
MIAVAVHVGYGRVSIGQRSHELLSNARFGSPPWVEMPVGAYSGYAVSRCRRDVVEAADEQQAGA